MKINKYNLIFFSFVLCFLMSCSENNIDIKPILIVTNKSENTKQYISQVFVKTLSNLGYKEVYRGKIITNNLYYIGLMPDIYSVKIKVVDNTTELPIIRSYETKNIFKEFAPSLKIIAIFDGSSIKLQ